MEERVRMVERQQQLQLPDLDVHMMREWMGTIARVNSTVALEVRIGLTLLLDEQIVVCIYLA